MPRVGHSMNTQTPAPFHFEAGYPAFVVVGRIRNIATEGQAIEKRHGNFGAARDAGAVHLRQGCGDEDEVRRRSRAISASCTNLELVGHLRADDLPDQRKEPISLHSHVFVDRREINFAVHSAIMDGANLAEVRAKRCAGRHRDLQSARTKLLSERNLLFIIKCRSCRNRRIAQCDDWNPGIHRVDREMVDVRKHKTASRHGASCLGKHFGAVDISIAQGPRYRTGLNAETRRKVFDRSLDVRDI